MKSLFFVMILLVCACGKESTKRDQTSPDSPPQVFLVGNRTTPGVYITEVESYAPTKEAICEFGEGENLLRFTVSFITTEEKEIVYVTSLTKSSGIFFEDFVLGLVSGVGTFSDVTTRLVLNEDLKSGKLEASLADSSEFKKIAEVSNCSFGETK